jgi:methylated-DNA-[protein]-cysteine S-methyltransferase
MQSPLGPIALVGWNRQLRELHFDVQDVHQQQAIGRETKRRGDVVETLWDSSEEVLEQAECELKDYFLGNRRVFSVAMALEGTSFQQRVWQALCEVPYGETSTYGELAQRIGSPAASRAVGAALGRNPIGILVPCHRIVGRDGHLVGFAGGLPTKQFLLEHERRFQSDVTAVN